MDYGTETTDLQARIDRLEGQLKAFRFATIVIGLLLLSQIWTYPRLFHALRIPHASQLEGADVVKASRFEVVNAAGETVAELGQKNGATALTLYGNTHQPMSEFSVFGYSSQIVFYDKEQKQRAAFGMMGAPTLTMHDTRSDVRTLLTTDDTLGSVFWVKDKDGFAAVLGNVVDETRKIEKVDGKEVPRDTVQRVPGVTI